jgi:hypothetical protein
MRSALCTARYLCILGVSVAAVGWSGESVRASTPDDAAPAQPTQESPPQDVDSEPKERPSKLKVAYDKGLNLWTEDGHYRMHLEARAQFRYTDQSSEEHPGVEDFVNDEQGFLVQRARIKLGGHAYREWLKYYVEIELVTPRLLDLHFTVQPKSTVGLRVGQFKVLYNRERVDSSGKLQFADRSIVTAPFTLDRQQGVTLLGRLFAEKAADAEYALGVFTGTGRGGGLDDDGRPMVSGRWQWNFLRRPMPFTESDIDRASPATSSIAVAAASNVGRYTRFSSSGADQLLGLPDGEAGQYETNQAMGEFAYKRKGLYAQAEAHWKKVDDRINGTKTELHGYYAQIGYFFRDLGMIVPAPLEFGLRGARVTRDFASGARGYQDELTLVANWFFHGHRNKLTADLSYLTIGSMEDVEDDETIRVRAQWDVSF